MAAVTSRTYTTVLHTGASNETAVLRNIVGQDTDDNEDLPIETFLAVEATGVGAVNRD
jgi:hypothetical protein